MSATDRPRRSRSRSPAESLISKISKPDSQSNAHRRTRVKSWNSNNIARSPSRMSNGQRISVHVGELLIVPEPSPRYITQPGSQSRSVFSPSTLRENTPSPFNDRPVSGQPSNNGQPESVGDVSSERIIDIPIRPTEMSHDPRSPPILGIFPAPPSPLDHFEKWFPESPTEVPVAFAEKQEPCVDKRLPQPPYHVFDSSKKRQLVILVSFVGILSPLSSSMYFPAITAIAKVSN